MYASVCKGWKWCTVWTRVSKQLTNKMANACLQPSMQSNKFCHPLWHIDKTTFVIQKTRVGTGALGNLAISSHVHCSLPPCFQERKFYLTMTKRVSANLLVLIILWWNPNSLLTQYEGLGFNPWCQDTLPISTVVLSKVTQCIHKKEQEFIKLTPVPLWMI